jgi:hypothetical protein
MKPVAPGFPIYAGPAGGIRGGANGGGTTFSLTIK